MPETKTTGFVIAVTFLPAPLLTPGDGVSFGSAWVDVWRAERGVTSLQKLHSALTEEKTWRKGSGTLH